MESWKSGLFLTTIVDMNDTLMLACPVFRRGRREPVMVGAARLVQEHRIWISLPAWDGTGALTSKYA